MEFVLYLSIIGAFVWVGIEWFIYKRKMKKLYGKEKNDDD